jgi:hypothetical protein
MKKRAKKKPSHKTFPAHPNETTTPYRSKFKFVIQFHTDYSIDTAIRRGIHLTFNFFCKSQN